MSVEHVLLQSPWISYNDKFFKSRITLTYPENVIFVAQFLKHVSESEVYKKYPYAEKMEPAAFQKVDWKNAIIVFDNDLQLILAPDPVHQLVRLNRRLQYKDAATNIFGFLRVSPFMESFRFQGWVIFLVLFFYGVAWIHAARYRVRSLVLPNKISTESKGSPNP